MTFCNLLKKKFQLFRMASKILYGLAPADLSGDISLLSCPSHTELGNIPWTHGLLHVQSFPQTTFLEKYPFPFST